MSESVTPEAPAEPVVEAPKETDWKAEARKWEDRAKENLGKAKTNETAAQRLAEIEDANKSELERVAARAEAAEKRAAELEAKSLRVDVSVEKGVPAHLLTGSTKAELEASADALIAFRGEKSGNGLLVPTEGNSPKPQANNEREFAKNLFGSAD